MSLCQPNWADVPLTSCLGYCLIAVFLAVLNFFALNLMVGDLVVGLAVAGLSLISSLAMLAFLVVFKVLIKLFFSMLMIFTPFELMSV